VRLRRLQLRCIRSCSLNVSLYGVRVQRPVSTTRTCGWCGVEFATIRDLYLHLCGEQCVRLAETEIV
jgi:hypothetical protein